MDWCLRLEEEHRVSKSAYFVTLTYDRKHLRTDNSLCKRDLQLYLKRLRKKDETTRIRYYAVGEYGTRTGRPHYHIILFNASSEDDIRNSWLDSTGQSIGFVHIGKVTSASIAYCTKYVIQKASSPNGLEKPFSTMSRSHGIGGNYLSDLMVAWHREDDRNYVMRPGGEKRRLPRFYRDKIFWKPEVKTRISNAALILTMSNQAKENDYYQRAHGEDWETVKAQAQGAVISRVKQKIQFTQTF